MDTIMKPQAKGPKRMLHLTALLFAGLTVWALVSRHRPNGSGQDPSAAAQTAFEEKTGVRLVRVAATAAGGLLDLRYMVLDPGKAWVVHDRGNPPTVIDEATGKTFHQPWMEHSHRMRLRSGQTRYDLLLNPGGVIERGRKVTVAIGEARLEHVTVQ